MRRAVVRRVVILVAPWALVLGVVRAVELDAQGGTQQCNTECQSKMTDCVLACDGIRSCEEACKRKAEGCVSICTSDAGPPPLPIVDAEAEPAPLDGQIFDARRDARKVRGDR